MQPLKTATEIRLEISDLIAEAVAEADEMRRTALLVMADHWVALLQVRLEKAQCGKGMPWARS